MLVLNDHWLKAAAPGLVSGKLSDVAGLIVFPVMLLAIWELAASTFGHPSPAGLRTIAIVIVATAIGFAAVKVAPPVTNLFGTVLGAAQWLAGLPVALLSHAALGSPTSVEAWTDPTDLLALPALGIAWWIASRRARGGPSQAAFTPWTPRVRARLRTGASVAVLLAAGVATMATEATPATPPPSTSQSFPVSFAMSAATPVAVRDLTISADPAGPPPAAGSSVELELDQPGLRVFAGPETPAFIAEGSSAIVPHPSMVDPGATAYALGSLPDGVTSLTVRLIVELTEASLGPLAASGKIVVTTFSGTGTIPSPAHVEIQGLEGASLPPPGETTAGRTGTVTLDAAHPIVSERFVVQVEQGTVTDPAALILDESLDANLDTQGAEVKVLVTNDVPDPSPDPFGQPRYEQGPNGTKSNLHAAIPSHVPCATNSPCTFAYVVSFEYAGDATLAAQLHWDFRVSLADYAHGRPPANRQVGLSESTTVTPAGSPQAGTTSISGRTLFAAGSQRSGVTVLVNPELQNLPIDVGHCAITGTVSFSAIDVTSGQSTTTYFAQLGAEIPPYRAGLEFSADGQPRTLAFGHAASCLIKGNNAYVLAFDFEMPNYQASSPSSIVVNWTASFALTSLSGEPLANGPTLTLRPQAGSNTTFAPPY